VKVSGLDAQGNPFKQTAYASNVSHWGARIDGIMCLRKPGQLLDVQYKGKTAKYVVVWLGKAGTRLHGHIGIKNLVPDKNIFGMPVRRLLSDPYASAERAEPANPSPEVRATSERRSSNRRRYTRHACVGAVEFRMLGSKTNMSGKLTDLSLGGCYIQAPATCPRGTVLELVLEVGETRLHAQGKVTVVNSAAGMGVEFTSADKSISRLPALINSIRLRQT
jgi:hypothetical protein